MSEYQRYEFMTSDRPLTRAELDAVNTLSSHIEASSTHAVIEYSWGDFKHDPIRVLRDYFDGFLYWANWGSPQLAFRFPHGILPADLLKGYDFGDETTFTRGQKYDILALEFGEMEAPDEWVEYELGSLMAIRDELMEGDLRALYIAWLASQSTGKGYYSRGRYEDYDDEDEDYEEDEEEDYDDEEEDYDDKGTEDEDEEHDVPPVPPGFGKLTAAQYALAELLQVPEELLIVTGRHSSAAASSQANDDIAAWVKLLSPERRDDYLVRLARNEPGLGRQFIRELRELNQDKDAVKLPTGERVPYAVLLAESKTLAAQLEREQREKEQAARRKHLQEIYEHQEAYWQQADRAATRKTASGYDEAVKLLTDLRDTATEFHEIQKFQKRFEDWIPLYERSQAFVRRLHEHKFTWG